MHERGGSKGKAGEQTGEQNEVLKSESPYPCGFQAIIQSYLSLPTKAAKDISLAAFFMGESTIYSAEAHWTLPQKRLPFGLFRIKRRPLLHGFKNVCKLCGQIHPLRTSLQVFIQKKTILCQAIFGARMARGGVWIFRLLIHDFQRSRQ